MASHSLSLPVLACNVSTKKLDLQTPCCVCLKEGRLCFALLCFGNQKSFWSSCQQSLGHLFVLLGRVNRATVRNETPEKWNSFSRRWWMGCWNVEDQHPKQTSSPSGRWKKLGFYTQLRRGTAEWTAWKPLKIAAAESLYKVAADLCSVISTKFTGLGPGWRLRWLWRCWPSCVRSWELMISSFSRSTSFAQPLTNPMARLVGSFRQMACVVISPMFFFSSWKQAGALGCKNRASPAWANACGTGSWGFVLWTKISFRCGCFLIVDCKIWWNG